ncbi:MAG: ABC transporter substrate-binding protein [Oscillospiraceae bacterium]|jgi:peptide/nickel transport system substrate-binding protein|nr:ABC transporter substrate-binding protein [Oscillospiraceae bacterium]
MKTKSVLATLLALVMCFALLASCGGDTAPAPTSGGSVGESEEAPAGATPDDAAPVETVRDSIVVSIADMTGGGYDPIWSYSGVSGYDLFHTSLLKINADVETEPDIASSYKISDDGLRYTYTIREDIKFADGTTLTPEDVAFTYRTAKEAGGAVDLTMVESIEVSGNDVIFTLSRVYSPFIRTTALLGIVPEHAYDDSYANNPVGTGPFKVKQLDIGQQLIIEPNEYFYGIKSPFKQITFLALDEQAALASAQTGALDVVMVNPEYAKESVAGMHMVTCTTSDNRGFNLPMVTESVDSNGEVVGNNVTSDIAVRTALNMGINRQTIIDNALNGIGTPSYTYFQGLPWGNTEPVFIDGQVEEAKAILEAAGWVDTDGDGIREKDGVKCEFRITGRTDDLQRYNLAVALSESAKPLGINIIAEAMDWTTARKLSRNIPTCIGTGSYTYIDIYTAFHSMYAVKDSAMGLSGAPMYANDTVDGYLDAMLAAKTDEEAIALGKKAQYDGQTGPNVEFPYVWLVNIDHTYFVRDGLDLGVQRIHPHGHGAPVIQNLNEWSFIK